MSKRLGYLIDTRKCNNCKTCEIACKMERRLPVGIQWRKVRRIEDERYGRQIADEFVNNTDLYACNVTMSCNHCEKPQCVDVCPMHAHRKMPNGVVVHDPNMCIGCTKCVGACPYSAPVYNSHTGRVGKCDMCYTRMEEGMEPYCVQTCPNEALKIDEYENLVARFGIRQTVEDTTVLPDPSITNPSVVIVED